MVLEGWVDMVEVGVEGLVGWWFYVVVFCCFDDCRFVNKGGFVWFVIIGGNLCSLLVMFFLLIVCVVCLLCYGFLGFVGC